LTQHGVIGDHHDILLESHLRKRTDPILLEYMTFSY
jgi:hypothetical protein